MSSEPGAIQRPEMTNNLITTVSTIFKMYLSIHFVWAGDVAAAISIMLLGETFAKISPLVIGLNVFCILISSGILWHNRTYIRRFSFFLTINILSLALLPILYGTYLEVDTHLSDNISSTSIPTELFANLIKQILIIVEVSPIITGIFTASMAILDILIAKDESN